MNGTSARGRSRLFNGRNQALFVFSLLTYMLSASLCSKGYIQSFMLSVGIGAGGIALFGFVQTAFNLLAYLSFSFFRSRTGSYLPALKINALVMTAFPMMLALTGLFLRETAALAVLLTAAALYYFSFAIRTSAEYACIPSLFTRNEYAPLLSLGNILCCLTASLVSVAGSILLKDAEGTSGYILFFALAAVALLVSAMLSLQFRARIENGGAPVEVPAH